MGSGRHTDDHRGLWGYWQRGGGFCRLAGDGCGHHRSPRVQGDAAQCHGGGRPPPAGLPVSFQASCRRGRCAEAGTGLRRRKPGGCPLRPLLHSGRHWHHRGCDADGGREPDHCLLRFGGAAPHGFCGYSRLAAGGGAFGKAHYVHSDRVCPLPPHQCRRPYGGSGPGSGPAGN